MIMSTETILKRISTKDKEAFMKMVEESFKVVNDKPAKDPPYEMGKKELSTFVFR